MYVVVFEVLQREKGKEKVSGMAQLLCVILGFSVLMMVEIIGKACMKWKQNSSFLNTSDWYTSPYCRIYITFLFRIVAPHEHEGGKEVKDSVSYATFGNGKSSLGMWWLNCTGPQFILSFNVLLNLRKVVLKLLVNYLLQ